METKHSFAVQQIDNLAYILCKCSLPDPHKKRHSFLWQQADNLAYILCKCPLPEPHKTTLCSLHNKFCKEINSHKRMKNTELELHQQLAALTYVSKNYTLSVYHEKPLQDLLAEITKKINSKNKEKIMKIYIAGKVSGLSREDVINKFEAAQKSLVTDGHQVFIPCVLPAYEEVSHEDYMHICYAMIDICDAVFMLSDWQQSKGARMELQYAADHRKEILYEDPGTKEADFPIIYGHPKIQK